MKTPSAEQTSLRAPHGYGTHPRGSGGQLPWLAPPMARGARQLCGHLPARPRRCAPPAHRPEPRSRRRLRVSRLAEGAARPPRWSFLFFSLALGSWGPPVVESQNAFAWEEGERTEQSGLQRRGDKLLPARSN